jgi:hypothetical protein
MQFEQGLLRFFHSEMMSLHDWPNGVSHFGIANYLAEVNSVHLVQYSTPVLESGRFPKRVTNARSSEAVAS